MTNKLVIINGLKVPKIKKILLYGMKFLAPNYSCLQNPWLGGYRPPDTRSLCPLSSTEFVEPHPNKIPGYATACAQPYSRKGRHSLNKYGYFLPGCQRKHEPSIHLYITIYKLTFLTHSACIHQHSSRPVLGTSSSALQHSTNRTIVTRNIYTTWAGIVQSV